MANDVKDKIFGEKPSIDDIPSKHDGDRLLKLYDKLNKCVLRCKYILSDYDDSVKDLFGIGYVSKKGMQTMELLESCGVPYQFIVRDYKEYCYLQTMINQFNAQIDSIVGGYR